MKLLVDVGNTALKLATHEGQQINFVTQEKIDWTKIELMLVASVRQNEQLEKLIKQAKRHSVRIVNAEVSAVHNKVICGYKHYQNLGIDRWLVVLGAAALHPNQTTIIIDAGTATTLDVLIDGTQHQGGWIIPGIDLMMGSITKRAEKVFKTSEAEFKNKVGENTPVALSYGCLAATLGLAKQARALYGQQVLILCTGGYGKLISDNLENSQFIEDLVLQGLVNYSLLPKAD
jgi:type III pantothenate kinase